ncbi:hypothetical protein BX257_4018 [Streptomyces sp. 3212.3]|nr:hypothetical protein BX257_4018 [Streptomyces sp. 3212.3]
MTHGPARAPCTLVRGAPVLSGPVHKVIRMDDQQRHVRITAEGVSGAITMDGRDISRYVSGYELHQLAGKPAELVLRLSPMVKDEFDGLARVVVGELPDPGPAAAAFLGAIDAGELERHVLARHDLMDGGPHELTRAMLVLLQQWANGQWQPEVAG